MHPLINFISNILDILLRHNNFTFSLFSISTLASLFALIIYYSYLPSSSIFITCILLFSLITITTILFTIFSIHHYVSNFVFFKVHLLFQPKKPPQIHIFVDHETFDWPITVPEPVFRSTQEQESEPPTPDETPWL